MRTAHLPAALLTGLLALASVSLAAVPPGASPALPAAASSAPPAASPAPASTAAPSQAADPATLAAILGGQAPRPVVSCSIVCSQGFYCCIVGLRPTCYPWNRPCPF
jgi:hypothetical protein